MNTTAKQVHIVEQENAKEKFASVHQSIVYPALHLLWRERYFTCKFFLPIG